MKILYLVRHAKSDWTQDNSEDFLRPLNKRGFKIAPLMGELLAARDIVFDAMISSPALRALTTAQIIAEKVGFSVANIMTDYSLYESSHQQYIDKIAQLNNDINSVAVVGHNPVLTILTQYLCNEATPFFPTCAVAALKFPHLSSWEDVDKGSAVLTAFDTPKNHFGYDD